MTHVSTGRGLTLGVCLLLAQAGASLGQGTGFDSGSNESDGALSISGGGTMIFDPVARGIDLDGDRVFHFTTIDISASNLRFAASVLGEGRPIVFLASGPVTISGSLNLNGLGGHNGGALPTPADAGAGGFFGGPGGTTLSGLPSRAGSGPGGGVAGVGLIGGGAGHLTVGSTASTNGASGGSSYGNVFLLPALGGSGGGGGAAVSGIDGGGGGGGGGSIIIASSVSISVTGFIQAQGGGGGGTSSGGRAGGGGSGGSIRLIAPSITGNGSLTVQGGGGNAPGAAGRIRLESFQTSTSVSLNPTTSATRAGPGPVFPPANAPKVRVTAVGGVAVAATPTGSFVTPDVVINSATPVSLDIAAENIPPGTQVRVTLVPENGASMTLTSTPLAGTQASSTATVGPVTIPHGFSRFFVAATWTPQ